MFLGLITSHDDLVPVRPVPTQQDVLDGTRIPAFLFLEPERQRVDMCEYCSDHSAGAFTPLTVRATREEEHLRQTSMKTHGKKVGVMFVL